MSNFFTKLTSAVSVATLVAASTSASLVSAASEFLPYAQVLADNGIIGSQTTEAGYRLGNNITRAEMAKVVANLGGIDAVSCAGDVFGDVGTGLGDLCGYVEALANAGVVSSTATLYRPSANVTRAEMVKMMLGALGETPSDVDAGYMDLAGLGDLAGYVNRANEIGCIGTSDYFRPNASSSRGEVFKVAAICAGLDAGTTPVVPPVDGTGVVVPPTGTGTTVASSVSVALDGTPMAQYVPYNASNIKVGSIKLTAGTTDATIGSIVVTRSGLGLVAGIDNVSLGNSGVIVSNNATVNSSTQNATIRLSPALVVKAGTTTSLDVLVALKFDQSTSSSYQNNQHQFAVTAVNLVNGTSTGVPVTLGLLNTTSYSVGSTTVDSLTPSTVTSGKLAQRFMNVKLSVNRDATINGFTLTRSAGTDVTKAFANVAVYKNSAKVGTVTMTTDKIIVSALNTTLLNGETADFELRGDVVYVGAADSITLKVENSTDISATEKTTGYSMTTSGTPVTATAIVLPAVQLTWTKTTTGSLTVSPGTSSVTLFNAQYAADASFDVTSFTVAGSSTDATALNSAVLAQAQFSRLTLTVAGVDYDMLALSNPANTTFSATSDKFSVDAGAPVTVKIVGTLKSNATSPKSYKYTATINTIKNNSNGSTVTPTNNSQAGDTVNVSNGKATFKAAAIAGPSTKKLSANQSRSEIGRFSVLAEAEDINVRKLVVSNSSVTVAGVAEVSTFTVGAGPSTVAGTIAVTVNGTTYTTSSLAMGTTAAQAALAIKTAIGATATCADATCTSGVVTVTAAAAGAQTDASVGTIGATTLTAAAATTTQGVTAVNTVTDLRDLISGNAVKLVDVDTNLDVSSSVTVAAGTITLDNLNITVQKDVTKTYKLVADTTSLTALPASAIFTMQINAITAGDVTRLSSGNADVAGAVIAVTNTTGQFVAANSTYTAGKVPPTVTIAKSGTDLDTYIVTVKNIDSENAMDIVNVNLKAKSRFAGSTSVTWDGMACVRNGATGQCNVAGLSTAAQNIGSSLGATFTLAGIIPNLNLVKNTGTVSFNVYVPNLPALIAGDTLEVSVANLGYDSTSEDYTGVSGAKVTATK